MAFNRSQRQSVMAGASPMVEVFPTTDPSSASKKQGLWSSADRRAKSQPGSTGTAPRPIRGSIIGPSPGTAGPSPGNWASPAWSASPHGSPPYQHTSPADFKKMPAEGQWWLLEARRMREEARRMHGDNVRLSSVVADNEEEMKSLESMLESKSEHADKLSSELQEAVNSCNILYPEWQQSHETRERQQETVDALTQRIEEAAEDRRQFQDRDMRQFMVDLKASKHESRELGRQLRRAQTAVEAAEQVTATEGAAASESSKFRSEAAVLRSELSAGNRQTEELEESLRQALEQAKAAQVDRAELKRLSTAFKFTTRNKSDEHELLRSERDSLREEVRKLSMQIQKVQEEAGLWLEVPTGVVPQRPASRFSARVTSDVDSSGCDDNTIDVVTPRSQITGGSPEPSEANFRSEGRLKKNATNADVRAAEAQLRKVYLSYMEESVQGRPTAHSVISSVGFSESPSYSTSPASDFRAVMSDVDVRSAEATLRRVYHSAASSKMRE